MTANLNCLESLMRRKHVYLVLGLLAAALVLLPLILPIFFPWSEINCRHQDINIKTGQARYSRCLWFITISERIADTPLSQALQGQTIDVAPIKAWHRVNTFMPGAAHISPSYRFHGALSQADQMDRIAQMLELTPQQRQKVARAILTTWQESGQTRTASDYLQNLFEESFPDPPDTP